MSRLNRHALTTAAAFFALCATVVACGPGGSVSRSSSYAQPRYTPSYQTTYATTKTTPVAPVITQIPNTVVPVTPAVPQARISVVTADATPATPVARIQLAPATPEPQAKVEEVAKTEPKPETKIEPQVEPKKEEVAKSAVPLGDDPAKMLAGLLPATDEPSKIPDTLKGLVGPWMAVSRQGNGELSTVELLLNDNGWAKLTVPGADGKPATSNRKIEFQDNELKLTGGDADVLLGKLVEFDSRQMVLERQGGQVTFVRP